MASPIAAFENRLEEALAASEAVLADPNASPWGVEYAAFGGMLALALMGRGSEVAPMASRFHDVMNTTDGLLRYPASLGEMLGMLHAGQLDLAQRRADEATEFSRRGSFSRGRWQTFCSAWWTWRRAGRPTRRCATSRRWPR